MFKELGPKIPSDFIVASKLEDEETVYLITSGGLLLDGQLINPMGHVYLTSRRVIFVPDDAQPGRESAETRWTGQRKVVLDSKKYGPNRLVTIDGRLQFAMPKKEAQAFEELATDVIAFLFHDDLESSDAPSIPPSARRPGVTPDAYTALGVARDASQSEVASAIEAAHAAQAGRPKREILEDPAQRLLFQSALTLSIPSLKTEYDRTGRFDEEYLRVFLATLAIREYSGIPDAQPKPAPVRLSYYSGDPYDPPGIAGRQIEFQGTCLVLVTPARVILCLEEGEALPDIGEVIWDFEHSTSYASGGDLEKQLTVYYLDPGPPEVPWVMEIRGSEIGVDSTMLKKLAASVH